jgi:23S rRNA (cytosine1962-C5)-methyltransferase
MFPIEKILAAIDKRRSIRSPDTNAIRLVDGSGDGLVDFIIDDFAGRWLMQTKSRSTPAVLPSSLGYQSLYWKRLHQTERAAPLLLAGTPVDRPFFILEEGRSFEIDFGAGYSQGIFLDQRTNRSKLFTLAAGKTVLNTFAYTCAFGVAAAAGGAATTNLDLSRQSLEWGKRNYQLNHLDLAKHDFIYGDVFDWLGRFSRRQRRFDIIILDPPTFSRNRQSKIFRVETDYGSLVQLALHCLEPDGVLLCSTNSRTLTHETFRKILRQAISRHCKIESSPMPPDFTGEQYLKSFWVRT